MNQNNPKIGILSFGSLISDPGEEIQSLEIERIDCETPFKVEYARISSSRCNAPTLIPIEDESKGKSVKAQIIVLNENIELEEAKSILYRREIHTVDWSKTYSEPKTPTSKNVLIEELRNFHELDIIIYTKFLIQKKI